MMRVADKAVIPFLAVILLPVGCGPAPVEQSDAQSNRIAAESERPQTSRPVSKMPIQMPAVRTFDLNGVRLYLPNHWVWKKRLDTGDANADYDLIVSLFDVVPQPKVTDAADTVYRVERGITVFPVSEIWGDHQPEVKGDFPIFRIDLDPGPRNLAAFPRKSVGDLLPAIRARLGPVDEDGFRQLNPPTGEDYYGALPGDVTPSGDRLLFHCPVGQTSRVRAWCHVNRTVIDGLAMRYAWKQPAVPKPRWRDMDARVQHLVEWLATPPDKRPNQAE